MHRIPKNQLQQAEFLAKQAAEQMREAADLADQAAELFQHALALANTEQLDETQAVAYMAVPPSRRKKKSSKQTETMKLIQNLTQRTGERRSIPAPSLEALPMTTSNDAWLEGDDWWKPLPPVASDEEISCQVESQEKA